MKNASTFSLLALLVALVAAYAALSFAVPKREAAVLDATPQNVILSGTYGCLPHVDTSGPQTMECAFGLHADTGEWYAVNFGASAHASEQFQSGAHIRAEGNVVIKEALSSDHWQKYDMKGIFTVTRMLEVTPGSGAAPSSGASAKINIDAVCEGVLAYMTFPDGDAAATFVAECKEGKHPEVIEKYKADMHLDGAAI